MLLYPAAPTPAAEPAPTAEPSTAAATEQPSNVLRKERPTAPLDVSYIPAEAAAAVVIHPQPLLTGPNAEWMPVEIITAAGMQQFGVDPLQIQEALAFLVPPPAATPQAEPGFGVVLRFAKPYDKAALLAKLPEAKQIEQEGKTFYQLPGPEKLCVHLPDERTIILGLHQTLLEMLAAKEVDSPLVKLLKSTDFSGTYTSLVSLDAMRDLITNAMVKMPRLPPPLDQFRKLPLLVSSAKIRFDVAEGADFNLTLHAVDDQAAGELLELANNAVMMGRQMMLGQMQQGMGNVGNDPVQQAGVKYTTRIVNRMFDLVKPVRTGRNVNVSLHTDAGVAVIGVLVALLLPAVQAVREAARRTQSSNNLKQIGLALLNYESAYGRFPARAIFDKNGKPLLSWRVQILPFIEEAPLYKEFHLDEPWDSEHNKPLIANMPRIYGNPSRPMDSKTNYLVPVGPGTVFEGDKGLKISQITDGTSNTILAVEANEDRAVIWSKPDDLPVNLEKPLTGLGGLRPSGFQAIFCDGSVRLISNSSDLQALKALFTYAGGDNVAP
jgi:type II secretory pathway pseudopilin PulG